jgi:hypothetical protein
MTAPREVVLMDRNGANQICSVEAFNSHHNILMLPVVDRAKPFQVYTGVSKRRKC